MSIEMEIEMLPVMLVEALVKHDFFSATYIKKRKEELEKWMQMNGGTK